MNTHIFIGIDAKISEPTQRALRQAVDSFGQTCRFTLCTVIPLPYNPMPTLMKLQGLGLSCTKEATPEQIESAEDTLQRAESFLQHHYPSLSLSDLNCIHPMGEVSIELARVAEVHALDCLVLGSCGRAFSQRLRRVCASSISREVTRCNRCPSSYDREEMSRWAGGMSWYDCV